MGTLLQELGHDIVLLHFIDRVLKKRGKDLFYIVSPATGPKIDIHFWNPEKNEYTSAYNISGKDFVPEFSLRINFDRDIVERLNKESGYQTLEWYQRLSQKLKRDLKDYVMELCNFVEENTGDLPDVVGIDETGKETIWAGLKFEGFGKNAREAVLRQFRLAQQRDVPFYLVIPKEPLYAREITDTWVKSNLPVDMKIYKFTLSTKIITPKASEITFVEVTEGKTYGT